MITEQWRRIIAALMPDVNTLSQGNANYIRQIMSSTFHLMRGGYVDWGRYPNRITTNNREEVPETLEKLFGHPLTESNNPVYVLFFFRCFNEIIKTNTYTFLNKYMPLCNQAPCIQVWNPTEGFIVELCRSSETIIGVVNRCEDPIPILSATKNSDYGCFLRVKGPIHEFFGSFGIEILADDEANTILDNLLHVISLNKWKNIDWEKHTQMAFLGSERATVIPTLERLLKKSLVTPASRMVYVAIKEPCSPLIRLDLTDYASRGPIWGFQRYGTVLFNLEEGYLIEIDLQGNITVGKI